MRSSSSLRFFAFAVALSVTGAFGCSGAEPAADAEQGEDAEIKSGSFLKNAAAIEIVIMGERPPEAPKTVTIATEDKLLRFLFSAGLAKQSANGDVKPTDLKRVGGDFRCPPSIRITMRGQKDEAVATANIVCGFGSNTAAQGVLKFGRNFYGITANADAIRAIAAEPLQVGDVLYGVAKMDFQDRTQPKNSRSSTDRHYIDLALDAVGTTQVLDPTKPLVRCLPSRTVTFSRAGATSAEPFKQIASLGFSCGSENGPGTFTATGQAPVALTVAGGELVELMRGVPQ